MKTIEEIKEVIKESEKAVEECEQDAGLIYQGWLEALEWVIS